MNFTATYSPEDNKLRLYAISRLPAELYQKVKAAGFRWAPKQELFVAPMWTPEREELLIELAGEIGDEDTSLVQRAEQRSERFQEYSEKRTAEAEAVEKTVSEIAERFPMGQPILVGHHSEKRARKDKERIDRGMQKIVSLFDTAGYWKMRAAGALAAAKYKELPGVRHRRIKKLTSELRAQEKNLAGLKERQVFWMGENITAEQVEERIMKFNAYDYELQKQFKSGEITAAQVIEKRRSGYERNIARVEKWIAHYRNRIEYETEMLKESEGALPSEKFNIQVGGRVLFGRSEEWLVVLRVNRVGGVINSITTMAPSSVTWCKQWKSSIEKVKDYKPPEGNDAAVAKATTKMPPICNFKQEGCIEMTEAEWKAKKRWSDFPYYGVVRATETHGAYRQRQVPGSMMSRKLVFITDLKVIEPPVKQTAPEFVRQIVAKPGTKFKPAPPKEDRAAKYRAVQKAGGVQMVVAPQLFPTPQPLAARMIEMLEIEPGEMMLEPSAGTGVLVQEAKSSGAEVTAVEISAALAPALLKIADAVVTGDFLEWAASTTRKFKKIAMNPPFKNGIDIKHIEAALGLLELDGVLVAICANGPRQNAAFKDRATYWEDLPSGTFSEQGTQVQTALVKFVK